MHRLQCLNNNVSNNLYIDLNVKWMVSYLIILVHSSDSAIKEFIKFVDEKHLLGRSFILFDLDDVRLFVSTDVAVPLQVNTAILPSVSLPTLFSFVGLLLAWCQLARFGNFIAKYFVNCAL